MRPRGQTPRMWVMLAGTQSSSASFNEAAGADPADGSRVRQVQRHRQSFNEAAGADPADVAVQASRCGMSAALQ